jgi:putative colanic acid biosynthesis UDP-glucose lipid carrier transferase
MIRKFIDILSKRRFSKYSKITLFLSDLFLLNFMYLFSFFLKNGNLERFYLKEPQLIFIICNIFWISISYNLDYYKLVRIESFEKQLIKVMKLFSLHFLLIMVIVFGLKLYDISRLRIIYFYALSFISIVSFRYVFLNLMRKIRTLGYNYRNVLFIGFNESTDKIYELLKTDMSLGYKSVGYFNNKIIQNLNLNYLGDLSNSCEFISSNKIDEIYISLSDKEVEILNKIIFLSEKLMIRIKIIPYLQGYSKIRKFTLDYYNSTPILLLTKEPLEDPIQSLIKRFVDLLFSLFVLCLIFPWLFPLIAIIIKFNSKGPVFFKQKRTGLDGKEFFCLKFRTMKINNSSDKAQATINDVRTTSFGRFLRKTSIDELPQFINVLLGQMSVVGPRPHMLKHTDEFSEIKSNYLIRHYIKPGITGWAQINGFRGETKTREDIINRVEHDIWYIENWTFFLDIKIIVKTITNALKGEDKAY